MWRQRTLAAQILLGVLAILLVTMSFGVVLFITNSRQTFDRQYEQRALAIANTVAQMPQIREALLTGDPDHVIRGVAADVTRATDADYVVVADRDGVRYSHPNPALIGRRLDEGNTVLDGRDRVGIDNGSLGRSANGRAPVEAADGRVIGEVSVGILETEVGVRLRHEIVVIALYACIALALGVLASWLMSRLIKRATFGLELTEMRALLQEREAMLHGIREGVIGIDDRGRISVINNEACRLLAIPATSIGRTIDEVVPSGRLRDLLTGAESGSDQSALTDDFLLVVNRMPVVLGGRDVGSVVTLRDRTELEALMRELNAVKGLTDALRAQEHEFSNRLHTMAGLLDLGEHEEAARYAAELSSGSATSGEQLRARIAPPAVAALLLAKSAIAHEQGIELVVTEDSQLDASPEQAHVVLTVLGNLIDNAFDALAGAPGTRRVTVDLHDDDGVQFAVSDTGPGVAPELADEIFRDGYSTKTERGGLRRGLGLALVHRIVHRCGGRIEVRPGPEGARFDVRLPPRPETASDPALRWSEGMSLSAGSLE
jgi:two-component system CitB family sensor kinase